MSLAAGVAERLRGEGVAAAPAERLGRYAEFLLERNARMNLTAARDADALAEHLRDSLTVVPFVRTSLVDIGSGGGFPAIPLAIVTGVPVTLVESTVKKARFLEEMLSRLGLEGRVVAERAERAGHEPSLRGRFATVTARAVASAPAVLELALPFLAVGGRGVFQRGSLNAIERTAATDAAFMLGGAIVEERMLEAGGERRILIVEQRSLTQRRFPRRVGVPVKRPLCMPEPAGDACG